MASTSTETIDKVRGLKAFAGSLRGATQRWCEKYSDRSHYDKQAFGFKSDDGRGLKAFGVKGFAFEAYVGTYGNSSVSCAWRVDQTFIDAYLAKALNVHKQAIFDTMAELAEAEAKSLADTAQAEVAALQKLLDDVRADPALMAEAA